MTSSNAERPQATPKAIESEPTKPETSWRPRIHSEVEFNTNPFENFDVSGGSVLDGASLNRSVEIKDATENTAPLQGSKDVSDEDYLGTKE